MTDQLETATLGGGCFWCVEAIFQGLKGVHQVVSGYAGGTVENPTYQQVCSGATGHAEVVRIQYHPEIISFEDLLDVFWRTHNPTTLNQQGADVGTQYRSVIFYHTPEQKAVAEKSKAEADSEALWPNAIVTEIAPFAGFYEAESYHDDYYRRNPNQPYCQLLIAPKVHKFRKVFRERLKDTAV